MVHVHVNHSVQVLLVPLAHLDPRACLDLKVTLANPAKTAFQDNLGPLVRRETPVKVACRETKAHPEIRARCVPLEFSSQRTK